MKIEEKENHNKVLSMRALTTLLVLGGPEILESTPALKELKVNDFDKEQILKAQAKRERKLERNKKNAIK